MRLGCTDSSSFAKGQGTEVVQLERFMNAASRDEMIAHGFADLNVKLDMIQGCIAQRDLLLENCSFVH